jgi:hypothetical protein
MTQAHNLRSGEKLTTVRDVVAALGGPSAVARLTGVQAKTVSAWQTRIAYLPPRTYAVLNEALAARHLRAPRSLWKMTELVE